MNEQEQIIKKALQRKLVSIKNPNFTEKIVEMHALKFKKKRVRPLEFTSIILGIIGAIFSLSLPFVNSVYELGLTEIQLMTTQIVPITYLFYQFLNEIFINGNGFSMKLGLTPKLLVLVFLMLTQASQANAKNLNGYNKFQTSLNGEATLSIDPLIEFFEIFNMIAGNPNINAVDSEYKTAVLNHFQEFKDHPSLVYYRSNFHKFFQSIDAPYSFLHSLEPDFTFRRVVQDNKWENHPEIYTLLSVFRQFAQDTDFSKFFNSSGNYYNILLGNTAYILSDFREKGRMLSYYGINENESHSFHLILNTLGSGNFGTGIKTEGGVEHYAVVTTGRSISGIPIYSKSSLENLIWHEFGHSFSNPLVDKFWAEFENISQLHVPIKESMASQAYHEWKTIVYEHMTRALNCRFEANKYGEAFSKLSQERMELGRKFIYVPPIVDQLKVYEQNRDAYPNLDRFMPQIISRLGGLRPEEIENLNKAVDEICKPNVDDIPENGDFFEMDNQIMIFSTSEKDSIGDAQLKAYLSMEYPNLKTMADTLALKADLSNFNLFVIGSFDGNEYIKENIKTLPIHMDSEKLIAGKTYHGEGYAYLTGWVHPDNPDKLVTYYIAQNPKVLLNFKWVRRGSTDFHILKNLVSIKADDYHRNMKIWIFP